MTAVSKPQDLNSRQKHMAVWRGVEKEWQLGQLLEYNPKSNFPFVVHFADNKRGLGTRLQLSLDTYDEIWCFLLPPVRKQQAVARRKEQQEVNLEAEREAAKRESRMEAERVAHVEELVRYCDANHIDYSQVSEPMTPVKFQSLARPKINQAVWSDCWGRARQRLEMPSGRTRGGQSCSNSSNNSSSSSSSSSNKKSGKKKKEDGGGVGGRDLNFFGHFSMIFSFF